MGACGIPWGPATVVAIVRKNVNADYCTIIHDTSFNWEFYLSSGDGLALYNGTNRDSNSDGAAVGSANFTVKVADGWCVVACSKAIGSVAPTFAKYGWSAATWSTMIDAATQADSSAWATNILMGRTSGATTGSSIDIAAVAVYNTSFDLTSSAFQKDLLTRQGWLSHGPVGMWELQQASTATSVTDTMGSGANQSSISATTVTTAGSEVDPWFVFTPIASVVMPQMVPT